MALGVAALAAPLLAHAEAQPSAGDDTPTASGNAAQLGEIIVTAQRRKESAQTVPIAITALSGSRLEQQGITSEQDLGGSVPSLVVGPNGQGSRESQSFTIRGQGATFEASPAVVEYFDEVPLPSPISLSQQGGPGNLFDLQNIQVLEGPQGTLFGRNTTGGAVLLVPNEPTNQFGGYLQAGTGNYSLQDYEGAINAPVVPDKLLVRASGKFYQRDGYTHDVVWNVNRDNAHWDTGRIEILAKPSERLENSLLTYWTNSSDHGTGTVAMGFNIPVLAAYGLCSTGPVPPVPAGYSCNVYSAAIAQQQAWGPRKVAYSDDVFQDTRTWGAINKTNYHLSDELTLRNIASYQYFRSNYAYDDDGTVLQQHDVDPYGMPPRGAVTLPYAGTPVTYTNTPSPVLPRDLYKEITEELQVQGTGLGDKLHYAAGGFYYLQEPAGMMGSAAVLFCPGLYTGTGGVCNNQYQESGVTNRSRALYVQSTLDLGAWNPHLDGLRLTGGYRYTWDSVSGHSWSYTAVPFTSLVTCSSSAAVVPAASGPTACNIAAILKSSASSWTGGLDYQVRPDLMVYAKASHSYKAGGFNPYAVYTTTETFEPEFDTTYETGFKSDIPLAGIPARLNADYYFTDYSGIQRATGDTNFATGAGGAAIRNADAHIQGVELEALIRPFKYLELGANYSYTDAKYTRYTFVTPQPQLDCSGAVVAVGGTVNLKCLPFQYVTPHIYSVNATVSIPIKPSLGALSFFISYSHNSEQYTDAVQPPSAQPGAMLPAYGLLNMSLDWKAIGGGPIDLGFFVTNATNKFYRISNSDVYQSLLVWSTIYGEPRMFGGRIRYNFGE